jgi:hypothetical protein
MNFYKIILLIITLSFLLLSNQAYAENYQKQFKQKLYMNLSTYLDCFYFFQEIENNQSGEIINASFNSFNLLSFSFMFFLGHHDGFVAQLNISIPQGIYIPQNNLLSPNGLYFSSTTFGKSFFINDYNIFLITAGIETCFINMSPSGNNKSFVYRNVIDGLTIIANWKSGVFDCKFTLSYYFGYFAFAGLFERYFEYYSPSSDILSIKLSFGVSLF